MRVDRPVRGDDVIPLAPLWELLRQQKQWLKFGSAGLLLSGLLLVGTVLFLTPKTEVCSMDLSLGFKGAQDGKYPNDFPFSAEELLDTAVLRAVYERHNLQQWIEFPEFESSLTIGQGSGDLQNISSEYLSRLSASKITGPDRQALEEEYRSRLRSASSTIFKLEWFDRRRSLGVPSDVKAKVLTDIPGIWAEQSVSNKQIYLFSSLLPGLNPNYDKEGESAIEKLAAISSRAQALEDGLASVEKLPGAPSVALLDGTTLIDLKLRLRAYREQALPSIRESMLTQIGTNQEILKLSQAMELQLKYRESRVKSSKDRLSCLVATYRDYLAGRPGAPVADTSEKSSNGGRFVELFFNRLLALAQTGADRDYLKTMLVEIESARIEVIKDELSCLELRENLEIVRSAQARQGAERPANSPLQPPPPKEDRATSAGAGTLRDAATQLGLLLDSSRQLVNAISESYLGHNTDLFSVVGGWEVKKIQPLSHMALVLGFVAWVVLGFFLLLVLLLINNRIVSLGRSVRPS